MGTVPSSKTSQGSPGSPTTAQRVPENQFIGKAKASLYMKPTYAPKRPLRKMMYRPP